MRRPNKSHRDGYEDEEDCVGYYDPDEAERRGCDKCRSFDRRVSETSPLTGHQCYEMWKVKDDARREAEWDAKTPEERAQHETMVKGLQELY